MGKKIKDQTQTPIIKKTTFFKKNKKNDNKQLFSQLATHQQQKIMIEENNPVLQEDNIDQPKKIDQNQYDEFQITDIKKQLNNSGKLSQVINQLLIKNKVNSKNAFDIPLINLQDLAEFSKTNTQEASWKKLSTTLESDSKIYSFRVDSTHLETFRILSSIVRSQKIENGEIKNQDKNLQYLETFINKDLPNKFGNQTIQKNLTNINIDNLQYAFSLNPYYEKTRRTFDEGGVKNIMLHNLKNNSNLRLMIELSEQEEKQTLTRQKIKRRVWLDGLIEGGKQIKLGIFEKIKKEKQKNHNYFLKKFNIQINYNDIDQEIFHSEDQMDIQQQQGQRQYNIQQFQNQEQKNPQTLIQTTQIINKPVNQKILKSYQKKKNKIGSGFNAYQEDAALWMSQLDMKFTKMRVQNLRKKQQILQIPKNITQNLEYFIDFNQNQIQKRNDEWFKIQLQKNQQLKIQQFQNYNMLPMNPIQEIDFNKTISLKLIQETIIQSYQMHQTINDIQVFIKNQQKKNQSSIRLIKQQLKKYINPQIKSSFSFQKTYYNFIQNRSQASQITIQSCFVTFLHLANQNNFFLENNQNQSDFTIKPEEITY